MVVSTQGQSQCIGKMVWGHILWVFKDPIFVKKREKKVFPKSPLWGEWIVEREEGEKSKGGQKDSINIAWR